MELLLGAGNSRTKRIQGGPIAEEWTDLVTLDIDPDCGADVEHDLDVLPYPFADDRFDEIHAYEILEHTGTQGDWRFFFAQFSELWRILRPGGHLVGTVPWYESQWAWGDPGHRRVFTPGSFVFLSQDQFLKQVGETAMTDYRHVYSADFDIIYLKHEGETLLFVLQAVKG